MIFLFNFTDSFEDDIESELLLISHAILDHIFLDNHRSCRLYGNWAPYMYFRTDEVKVYDLVESVVSLAAIVGLHGYAYQTAHLSPFFWQIVWVSLLVTWLASLGGRKNRAMIDKIGGAKGFAIIAATTIIGFLTLVGLFCYAFVSGGLWN